MLKSTSAIVAALALIAIAPAAAETHALVVGINAYAHVRPLKGAVADARDIAAALQARGVKDLTVLIDADATRDRLLQALDAMIDRVRRNDLVVISFAGHGSEEVWGKVHPPGVADGESHEVFLLAGVALPDSAGQIQPALRDGARERIMGSELAARLAALDAKGARTIFVADTCYGGGLTRVPLRQDGQVISVRSVQPYHFADKQDPLVDLYARFSAPIDTDHQLTALTFLAGVDKNHLVPEVAIPRGSTNARGALSYAFARLLEGTAHTADPTRVTRGELIDFVKSTIRSQVQNDQDPDLRPRADFNRTVIDFSRDMPQEPASPTPAAQHSAVSTVVRIQVEGGAANSLPDGNGGSVTLQPATSKDDADLSFDPAAHAVYSRLGDLVASDVGPADLADVAAREVALRRVTALSLSRPRELKLAGGDRRYVFRDRIVIDAGRSSTPPPEPEHYVLFDITGTGLVQFLYPYLDRGDPPTLGQDKPFENIDVRAPYGADTLVLVTGPEPLDGLIAALRDLNNRPAALDAVDLVERASTPEMRIGLQAVFTAAPP